NRTYNEVSTDIADIVNYHAAPVTVIIGAKANQLEKGANKVWGGLPKDAKVENLEGGSQGLQGAMEFLQVMKRAMHELTGVPESALGQAQPISNTSGVALSIQFQPLMNKYHQKIIQYSYGIQRINELILKTLVLKEPEALSWNPQVDMVLKPGQVDVLNPADPITYRSYVHFPPPLPLDKLIVLNEIQTKMSLGLESKTGALRALGEDFPDEKLEEIRVEIIDDAKSDGAVKLVQTMIENEIMMLSQMTSAGMMMGGQPPAEGGAPGAPGAAPAGGAPLPPMMGVEDPMSPAMQQSEQQLRTALVTKAYGTQLAQRKVPQEYER
ncbi:phage portal protein, partial [bacterium]|nr:phage portal protein [bacterium]